MINEEIVKQITFGDKKLPLPSSIHHTGSNEPKLSSERNDLKTSPLEETDKDKESKLSEALDIVNYQTNIDTLKYRSKSEQVVEFDVQNADGEEKIPDDSLEVV